MSKSFLFVIYHHKMNKFDVHFLTHTHTQNINHLENTILCIIADAGQRQREKGKKQISINKHLQQKYQKRNMYKYVILYNAIFCTDVQ